MLPVFRAVGVVFEFVVATSPRRDDVLPPRSVQRVELLLKDEAAAQLIELTPATFHFDAEKRQQEQSHDHDLFLSLHDSHLVALSENNGKRKSKSNGVETTTSFVSADGQRVLTCGPLSESNDANDEMVDPKRFVFYRNSERRIQFILNVDGKS